MAEVEGILRYEPLFLCMWIMESESKGQGTRKWIETRSTGKERNVAAKWALSYQDERR